MATGPTSACRLRGTDMSAPTIDSHAADTAIDATCAVPATYRAAPAVYNHGAAFPAELHDWQRRLREQFPIICANAAPAYLNNAAPAQKPRAVLDTVQPYLTTTNANVGRGTYTWADQTTALVQLTPDP